MTWGRKSRSHRRCKDGNWDRMKENAVPQAPPECKKKRNEL
eukprot:gene17668-biopygen12904